MWEERRASWALVTMGPSARPSGPDAYCRAPSSGWLAEVATRRQQRADAVAGVSRSARIHCEAALISAAPYSVLVVSCSTCMT